MKKKRNQYKSLFQSYRDILLMVLLFSQKIEEALNRIAIIYKLKDIKEFEKKALGTKVERLKKYMSNDMYQKLKEFSTQRNVVAHKAVREY